jgi:putative tributyrin esterase
MPAGENSFYLNGKGVGRGYETFTAEELPSYCQKTFGLSDKPEDNFIGGLSMGGFGAIHTALKYPERFGKMFGLSSALIVNGIKGMKPGEKNDIADYDYYAQIFGNLDQLDDSENNPEYLVTERRKKGETIQPIFMACGTEDFLLNENHEFRDFLEKEGVKVTYKESTGIHEWKFWNEYLEPAIQWLLDVE